MKWNSTRNKQISVSFGEAVKSGLAADGGLFIPEVLPPLPASFWKNFFIRSFSEISFDVADHLLHHDIPSEELRKIVEHTVTFDAPLRQLDQGVFVLELFHGPTLAFKDFGARFLAGVLGFLARKSDTEVTILVATSGDTGSAVAHGFFKVPGTRVLVLYPSGKVSDLQERQFTTLGENITALEVDGTFDDCQRMVKQAFADIELQKNRALTSANSINIARLIPQMFYYFRMYQQLPESARKDLIVSVPSGNFGNLTAGLIARALGLPVSRFIAATNSNAVVPHFLETGLFQPRPSVSTISNAMDVGNPSNFERLSYLFDGDVTRMREVVSGYFFSDEQTRNAMQEISSKYHYTADPHGAVGYLGLKQHAASIGDQTRGVFLGTAHPAKFREVVAEATGKKVEVPTRLARLLSMEKKSLRIPNEFNSLKDFLCGS